jgi:leucine-rich repeat-containing protein 49
MANLTGLPNLIFLDLYNNRIERIENIGSLTGLRVLMLGKNRIQVFL